MIKQILSSGKQIFVVRDDGSMYSSGLNLDGQLSHGDYENTNTFQLVVFKEKESFEPIIEGVLSDYGTCTSEPNILYKISDKDDIDNTLHVREYIDNDIVWEGTVEKSHNKKFKLDTFSTISPGNHNITIEVTDKQRHVIKTVSKFNKRKTNAPEIIIPGTLGGNKYNNFNIYYRIHDIDQEDTDKIKINYYINNNLVDTTTNIKTSSDLMYLVKINDLEKGKFAFKIEAVDTFNNKSEKTIIFNKAFKYKYRKYTVINKTKGKYIMDIIGDDDEYPEDGEKDGYWYIKGDKIDIVDEIINDNTPPIVDILSNETEIYSNFFNIMYKVDDDNCYNIGVIEKLDNFEINVGTHDAGSMNATMVDPTLFKSLDFGEHKYTIIATDINNNTSTKVFIFNKCTKLKLNIEKDNFNINTINGFNLKYDIHGINDNDCSVLEYIDNTLIEQKNVNVDDTYEMVISKDNIKKLENSSHHDIKIVVKCRNIVLENSVKFYLKYNILKIRNIKEYYGTHVDTFDISYKVSSLLDEKIQCFEYVDNEQTWTGNIKKDDSNICHINFDKLTNGQHTIKIIIKDILGTECTKVTKFDKTTRELLMNKRFAIIPLSKQSEGKSVKGELMLDNDGNIYIKNRNGKIISKTKELEKMIMYCQNALNIKEGQHNE